MCMRALMPLSADELKRYARHLVLPEIGTGGQEMLKAARVLIVGAGGLGSPAALYLAATGVDRIGIVDFDVVDETNLQRQILHSTQDVGRPKVESAKERILSINPHITVETHATELSSENAMEILDGYDVVIDGTDNFPVRYLVNDACVLQKKPHVYGSIFRFEGQASVFDARRGPCYRCLYPAPPPPGLVQNCADAGVVGVLPGIIGSIQANEALKLILGIGKPLIGRLLMLDALAMEFTTMKIAKDSACPVCGSTPTITHLIDYDAFCGVTTSHPSRNEPATITAQELKARIDADDSPFLLDVRELYERELASIGGVLIPLGSLASRLNELDKEREIVVYCHHGIRSAHAVGLLRRAGFTNVKNLSGGIDEWIRLIDGGLKRY
ncbi:MAG: molybdopterin-synthase adenylyltransferase MoeB [Bacteroidetes bacterium]|nr:molybdopterin-synthase adenylyltransferase MoeB [Bacteroidota bacterium]MCW5894973.1 molybdopterin-synthase adenylyltransferase MoeB [Bacteroidota bacterium]